MPRIKQAYEYCPVCHIERMVVNIKEFSDENGEKSYKCGVCLNTIEMPITKKEWTVIEDPRMTEAKKEFYEQDAMRKWFEDIKTDQKIQCANCKKEFIYAILEQKHHKFNTLGVPGRCPKCQAVYKESGHEDTNNGGFDKKK